MNNLPFESAGLTCARKVDPLEVIPSQTSAVTMQERRRGYRRYRSARLNFPQLECGPPTVEPRSITLLSSSLTDCECSLASIDFIAATNSNCKKVGVTSSAIPIRDSTSVSVVKSFPNRSF